LLETINRLVRNPAECRAMARRARKRALFFSSDRMGKSYWEVYQSILVGNKNQAASCMS
jgi:glycosyltransferase involved in cell wall biosynthesis